MCLAQGHSSDAGEARTSGPSVSSQALYHWATALPINLHNDTIIVDCISIHSFKLYAILTTFIGHGGHLGHVTKTICFIRSLQMKLKFKWSRSFWENYLCNFGRRYHEKTILWNTVYRYFLSGYLAALLFSRVQPFFIEGIVRNNSVKLFWIWVSGSGDVV